jgi:hypothetical protein
MHETTKALASDVDAELDRIVSDLAAAQHKRRADTRRRWRRQITAMLAAQGFSVGDIFPPAGNGRGGRRTSEANG